MPDSEVSKKGLADRGGWGKEIPATPEVGRQPPPTNPFSKRLTDSTTLQEGSTSWSKVLLRVLVKTRIHRYWVVIAMGLPATTFCL